MRTGYSEGEPWVSVAPHNKEKALFIIKLTFQNEITLNIDFIPQTFAASLIRNMGKANDDKKRLFCYFSALAIEKKARIVLLINDNKYNPTDASEWPTDWHRLQIHMELFPICQFPQKPDYKELVMDWGNLAMGMCLSLLDIVPINDNKTFNGYKEGNKAQVLTTRYERNRFNRIICLEHYGYTCRICGFNFQQFYGDIGVDFIHVHHIIPVSKMGDDYLVDPINDLIPVCPNCHSMLHKTNPPMDPDELRKCIEQNK